MNRNRNHLQSQPSQLILVTRASFPPCRHHSTPTKSRGRWRWTSHKACPSAEEGSALGEGVSDRRTGTELTTTRCRKNRGCPCCRFWQPGATHGLRFCRLSLLSILKTRLLQQESCGSKSVNTSLLLYRNSASSKTLTQPKLTF